MISYSDNTPLSLYSFIGFEPFNFFIGILIHCQGSQHNHHSIDTPRLSLNSLFALGCFNYSQHRFPYDYSMWSIILNANLFQLWLNLWKISAAPPLRGSVRQTTTLASTGLINPKENKNPKYPLKWEIKSSIQSKFSKFQHIPFCRATSYSYSPIHKSLLAFLTRNQLIYQICKYDIQSKARISIPHF